MSLRLVGFREKIVSLISVTGVALLVACNPGSKAIAEEVAYNDDAGEQENGAAAVAEAPAGGGTEPSTIEFPLRNAGSPGTCEIRLLQWDTDRLSSEIPGSPGADVDAVRSALALTIGQSRTMRDNLDVACARTGNSMTIRVKRGDPRQLISQAIRSDLIEIDLLDVEMAARFLSGSPIEAGTLSDSLLYAVLAHEIVHLRDGLQAHVHQLGQDATIFCPAVEDEAQVLSQLGFDVRRENYAYLEGGRLKTDYVVDGQRVVLNVSDLADASEQ